MPPGARFSANSAERAPRQARGRSVQGAAHAGGDGSSGAEADQAETPSLDDQGAPVGPDEAEEAAFLSGEAGGNSSENIPSKELVEADADEVSGNLPDMEQLISRIPLESRALLEELYRGKFYTVRRVPRRVLKK